jgi:valyl-tRNA synthetase
VPRAWLPGRTQAGEKTLKKLAIEVVRKGKIKILPERFEKTYFHWMENLHDWCISRQIWFGHQIPVWYCVGDEKEGGACKLECRKPFVQVEALKKCPHCGSKNLQQDPDTLDTWFSSGLWTFSTLGWPAKTADLKYFHPTSVLETGYDILFFWVARMIIMTTYALNEIPFKHVYLHGLVRTRDGKKMSKSDPKTCIDPLDMIEKYGADALRLSMVIGGAPGNDVRLYEEKIAGFRNFVNKIWNATRFALLQNKNSLQPTTYNLQPNSLSDRWILTRTQELISEVTDDIEHFRFSEAGMKIYDFTWGEYCAWYLEISKGEHQNLPVLHYVLETILKLLHPFVPYVTEALWKHLDKKSLLGRVSARLSINAPEGRTMLISASWPKVQKKFMFAKEAGQMAVIIEAITAIRNLRHEKKIDPTKKIHAVFVTKKWKKILEEKREPIMRLARLEKLEIFDGAQKIHPALQGYTKSGVEIILPVKELMDLDAERNRLTEELENLQQYRGSLEAKLGNENFLKRAPLEIVEAERTKLKVTEEKIGKIEGQLKRL